MLAKLGSSIRKRGVLGTIRLITGRAVSGVAARWKARRRAKTLKRLARRADTSGCVEMEIHGSRMRLDVNCTSNRTLERTLAVEGTREPFSTSYYETVLSGLKERWKTYPRTLVLDIGANVGYYTLLQARILGDSARIVAVEAEEDNTRRLAHNVSLNAYANVEVLNVAAGAEAGTGAIARRRTANVHRMAEISSDLSDLQPVQVVPIDSLVEEFAASEQSPVIVRMDIEGYEGFAFAGMAELLASERACYLFFELHPNASDWCVPIHDSLKRNGFVIERIDPTQGCSRNAELAVPGFADLLQIQTTTHIFCSRLAGQVVEAPLQQFTSTARSTPRNRSISK
jgi:FkbM family methyltransferase